MPRSGFSFVWPSNATMQKTWLQRCCYRERIDFEATLGKAIWHPLDAVRRLDYVYIYCYVLVADSRLSKSVFDYVALSTSRLC